LNPENTKSSGLYIFQTITLTLLIGGILGEQLKFLSSFYSKHIAHFGISIVLLTLSILFAINISKTKQWKYSIRFVLLLLIALHGLNLALKIHEYSTLSYLISYAFVIISGMSFAYFKNYQTVKKSFSYIFLLLAFIVGFIWRYTIWQTDLYQFLILLITISFTISLYTSGDKKISFIILLLLIPASIILRMNTDTIKIFKNQSLYADRVIFSHPTSHHQIDITTWRGKHWFYYNSKVQFSTVDEWLYSEPMVHLLMQLLETKAKVLVIGGENGILIKELLKYEDLQTIDLFMLDSVLFDLAKSEMLFTQVNQFALENKKVSTQSGDILSFLNKKTNYYDAIFIDVPDPTNRKWNAYYTYNFYKTCLTSLNPKGLTITQAGSPYFTTKAFLCIEKTMQSANYHTLSMHNQVLTLGEWGWILASKHLPTHSMKSQLLHHTKFPISSKWLNEEAVQMLLSFGKPLIISDSLKINTNDNAILVEYYKSGNYKFDL